MPTIGGLFATIASDANKCIDLVNFGRIYLVQSGRYQRH